MNVVFNILEVFYKMYKKKITIAAITSAILFGFITAPAANALDISLSPGEKQEIDTFLAVTYDCEFFVEGDETGRLEAGSNDGSLEIDGEEKWIGTYDIETGDTHEIHIDAFSYAYVKNIGDVDIYADCS